MYPLHRPYQTSLLRTLLAGHISFRRSTLTNVPEPLTISDSDIVERLRVGFHLDADAVEFLPLASDADVRGYRVHSPEGDRFLKIRRGPVSEVGLAVPQLLSARGIRHLIAPIPTDAGRLFDGDDVAFVPVPVRGGCVGRPGRHVRGAMGGARRHSAGDP